MHKNAFYMPKFNVAQRVFWNSNQNAVLSKEHGQILHYFLKFCGQLDCHRVEGRVGMYGNWELSKLLKPFCIHGFVQKNQLYFILLKKTKQHKKVLVDNLIERIWLKEHIDFPNWKERFLL